MVIDLARLAGLPVEPLVEGLSFDARSVRRRRRVPWDDYCTLIERLEVAAGGAAALDALLEASYQRTVPRSFQPILRTVVDARRLYLFFWRVANPVMFTALDFELAQERSGWLRLGARNRPGARPCLCFHRGSVATIRGAPAQLGLPPAEVEVVRLDADGLDARVKPPASRTVWQRVPSFEAVRRAALQVAGIFARDARDAHVRRTRAEDGGDLAGRAEALGGRLDLTPRQARVLSHLIRGASNKEIAAELACAENTVEFHVTQLLRKAGVQSRTQLLAKLAAERA